MPQRHLIPRLLQILEKMMDPTKAIESTVTSALGLFSRVDNEENPIGLSKLGRMFLIILCLAGTATTSFLTIEGLRIIIAEAHFTLYIGVTVVATIFLLLSKQIWLNRMGGGTFLFVFFSVLWAVSWIIYVIPIYWVIKSYILFDSTLTDTRFFEVTITARTIAEIVSLGAAIVLSAPPILLTLFLFSERLVGLNRIEQEELRAATTSQELMSMLLQAAIKGDAEAIKQIVAQRMDERDANGYTALMLAVQHGHTKAVKTLLDRGASVATRTPQGTTALMMAARSGNSDVTRTLVAFNPRFIDQRNHEGLTPLMLAVEGNHPQVVKLLVEAGADPYKKSKYGDSAMKLARRGKQQEIIELLRETQVRPALFGFRR